MENEINNEFNLSKEAKDETVETIIQEPVEEPKQEKPKKPIKITLKKIVWGIVIVLVFVVAVQIVVAEKYKAQVLVIEGEKTVGVNPTDEKLDFGDLSGDTSAIRYVTLKAGGIDTYIMVWKFGSIAELIKISENNFVMKKGDEKKLEFNVYMPPSAPVGEKYTGRVWIFKLPKIF